MYLKTLTLKGFKSFADKSVLNLEPGITAVVGPNGSGKSNISDAVLWVLGERNAKNLRGQAMEDVIFSGSSARKATGFAEVELVLDNTDGTLPVDFSEVVVTRRMYRSGESEYLINGAVARRMDVLDILHDSGLGTGTHSIISQGSLDSILRSKPEDRRALIEEAAGVLKHKQRMARSERKLEKMNNHVERIRDVVGEVQRQLAPLERKAKKAKKYLELVGDRDRASLVLAVDDLRKLQGQWRGLEGSEFAQTELVNAKKAEIEADEAKLTELQEKVRVDNIDAGELSKKHREITNALERIDSTTMMIRDRRRSSLLRAEELKLQIDALANERAKCEVELASARSSFASEEASLASAKSNLGELSELHTKEQSELRDLEKLIADLNADKDAKQKLLLQLRARQTQRQEALTNGIAHIKVIEGHAVELELQVERSAADAREADKETKSAEEALSRLSEQESSARALVGTCMQARQAARDALDEAKAAEQSITTQIKALEDIEKRQIQSSDEARSWMIENQESTSIKVEQLSHAIKVDRSLEALVESILGSGLDTLIIDNVDDATKLCEELESNDVKGKVSLAGRNCTSTRRFTKEDMIDAAKRVGGFALIEKVDADPTDEAAVLSLLGDVVVCDDIASMIEAHKSDDLGLRFYSKDAHSIDAGGRVIIGGGVDEEGHGVLSQLRHLEELKSSLESAREISIDAQKSAEDAESSLRDAQTKSLELSEQLALMKGNVSSLKQRSQATSEKLEAARKELENIERQKLESQRIIDEARPEVDEIEKQLVEITEQINAITLKLDESNEKLSPLKIKAEETSERLSEAKLEHTRLVERSTYNRRVIERQSSDLESMAARASGYSDQMACKLVAAKRLLPLLDIFNSLSQCAAGLASKLELESRQAQDSSAGLHIQITDLRNLLLEKHKAFDEINDALSKLRIEKARMEMQIETAVNVIVEDCHTPLDVALTEPVLENRQELEEVAFSLNRRIANLGTINPDAAQEYDELKQRYDYLAGQLSDLEGASRSLMRINRLIEGRIKDDFAVTFEVVNKNFQEIFTSLFPGGKANLALDDPEDIENTGVEVNAQPAGKRITKMSLMSGGEKSLTALALLFALYKVRSTPFYILDEVEAALDDTNLRRLVKYINDMRDDTQLIMITHQRRTMETADVLFGVSMQADGVTKVISQKLEHALRHAE